MEEQVKTKGSSGTDRKTYTVKEQPLTVFWVGDAYSDSEPSSLTAVRAWHPEDAMKRYIEARPSLYSSSMLYVFSAELRGVFGCTEVED